MLCCSGVSPASASLVLAWNIGCDASSSGLTEAAESIAAAVSRSRSTSGRRKLSTDALPSAPPLGPLAPLLHSPTPARDEAEGCTQTVWHACALG